MCSFTSKLYKFGQKHGIEFRFSIIQTTADCAPQTNVKTLPQKVVTNNQFDIMGPIFLEQKQICKI